MSEEEILTKYIELINKGYCCACNELNCIDNFPHKKIANAISNLQQENTYLKKTLENAQDIYKNSHKYTSECEDKVIELKSVLKEIREKLKEHNYTLDYEPWNFYEIQGNILFDLVEIIDKGIGEDK